MFVMFDDVLNTGWLREKLYCCNNSYVITVMAACRLLMLAASSSPSTALKISVELGPRGESLR